MILRAPRKAAAYFKSKDPDTAITESFVRKLIIDGDIPSVRNGKKVLVNCEYLERFLQEKTGGDADA